MWECVGAKRQHRSSNVSRHLLRTLSCSLPAFILHSWRHGFESTNCGETAMVLFCFKIIFWGKRRYEVEDLLWAGLTPSADTPLIIAPLCAPVMTLPAIAIIASSFTPLGPSTSSITHMWHRGRVLGVLRTVREQMERGSIFRRKFASNTKYEAAPTQNGATCFSAPNLELIWESEIPIWIVSGINRKDVFCNISKKYGRRRNLAVCSLSNGCRNSDAKPW